MTKMFRRRPKTEFIDDPRTREQKARDERLLAAAEGRPSRPTPAETRKRSREIHEAKERAWARLLAMGPIRFEVRYVPVGGRVIAREPTLGLEAEGRSLAQAKRELIEFIQEQMRLDPVAVLLALDADTGEIDVPARSA
jgi:hypothetical protein